MNPIIEVRHLSFSPIFNALSLSFEQGKFYVIAGGNNAGKTILVHFLSHQKKIENSIIVNHTYIESYNNHQLFSLIGTNDIPIEKITGKTVKDELIRPLEYLGWKKKEINNRIHEIAVLYHQENLLNLPILALSPKEKNIFLFLLAIIHHPKIVILDEPFLYFNQQEKNLFLGILQQLKNSENVTIILTTKDLNDAIYADELKIIHQGNLLMEGTPLAVFKEDKTLNRIGLSLPFLADLSLKLMFYDVLKHFILDMDGMVEQLWK